MRIDLRRFDAALGFVPPPPALQAPQAPPSLTAAWRMADIAWDEPAAHDALVGLAVKHGQLGWLASRYRERKDDPIAARQLERVQRAATVVMLATSRREAAEPSAFSRVWLSLALFALLIVGALAGARVVVDRAAAHAAHASAPAPVAP